MESLGVYLFAGAFCFNRAVLDAAETSYDEK